MKKWIEIKVLAAARYLELLSAFIFAAGAEGVQEEENDFTIYFEDEKWNPEVYQLLLKEFERVIPDFDEARLVVVSRADQNWMENWKQNFKVFRVGQRIVVQPDWENYQPKPGEIVLTIAPKMAFGTGHHETTRLCLLLMEKWFQPERRLLDAGTGSGILAIYAAKRGAQNILAVDNDPLAIENAQENAQLNRVEENIRFTVLDVASLPQAEFECIVANINRNVLLKIAPLVSHVLAPEGILVLSGVLKVDQEIVEKEYVKQGLKQIDLAGEKEWLGLVFEKQGHVE